MVIDVAAKCEVSSGAWFTGTKKRQVNDLAGTRTWTGIVAPYAEAIRSLYDRVRRHGREFLRGHVLVAKGRRGPASVSVDVVTRSHVSRRIIKKRARLPRGRAWILRGDPGRRTRRPSR